MMRFSRLLRVGGGLLWVMALLAVAAVATAQGPGDDAVEAAALRVHLQNLRTTSYTFWIGGNMGDPANAPARTSIGDRLEDWQLTGFAGDPDLTLDDLQRPTLFSYWASWCPPCLVEFPFVTEIALQPDAYAFDVVFVNMSDTEREAMAFLSEHPREIHTVVDELERVGTRMAVDSIPTAVLLDTDGTVLVNHVGILTPTVAAFLDAVAAAPGAGVFVASDHTDVPPVADLLPVSVEDAQPIESDLAVSGTLTDDDFQHAYRFEGRAGDVVRAAMTAVSPDLDTYLVLMTAEGVRLAENDDAQSGTDAQIDSPLPADGTYLLVATRFLEAEGYSVGDYRLTLVVTPGDNSAPNPQVENGHLGYGDVVAGQVSGREPRQVYAFLGQTGDVISIAVRHGSAETALRVELTAPDRSQVAFVDEAVAGEPLLRGVELPQDGEYLITISRPRSRDTEYLPFDLELLRDGPPPPEDGATLRYGQTVSGELGDEQYEQRWTFAGQAGDMISLVMAVGQVDQPGGLDGYLILIGPDGDTLIEADDWQGSTMPVLSAYRLPRDGMYTVVATRFGFANGFSSGAYTLTLEKIATSSPGEGGLRWVDPDNLPDDLRWLAYNGWQSGTITRDDFDDWFIFRGREGDVITLRLSAGEGDLDPFLILMDGGGYELARNDDAGPGTPDAALVDYVLPATGNYLLQATRYGLANGPSRGDYVLALETDAAPVDIAGEGAVPRPLALAESATGMLSRDQIANRYVFDGEAGQVVTISVQRTSDDLDPALVLRDPDGEPVAVNRDWLGPDEARLSRVTLPVDGEYTLEVMLDNLNTAGEYRLLLLPGVAMTVEPGAFVPAPGLDIEVVLIWNTPADLDLAVHAPGGDAPPIQRANDFCQAPVLAPVERLTWEQDAAAPGLYQVGVIYRFNCAGLDEPVQFLLALVRDGAVMDIIGGTLAREGDAYTTLLPYGE